MLYTDDYLNVFFIHTSHKGLTKQKSPCRRLHFSGLRKQDRFKIQIYFLKFSWNYSIGVKHSPTSGYLGRYTGSMLLLRFLSDNGASVDMLL